MQDSAPLLFSFPFPAFLRVLSVPCGEVVMLLALQSAFGFLALIGIAWVVSEDRRAVPCRIVISGVLLQIVLAALLLKIPLFKEFFLALDRDARRSTGPHAGLSGANAARRQPRGSTPRFRRRTR